MQAADRLKVKDRILSRDLEGNLIYVRIKKITKHKIDYVFKIFVEGSNCKRWHSLSPQQTVYDPKRDEWVQAQHINKATTVLDSDGNHCSIEKVVVERIEGRFDNPKSPSSYAYSIELESSHVFFSTARQYDVPQKPFRHILVHNGLPILLPIAAQASFTFGSTLASISLTSATLTASKIGLSAGMGLTGAGVVIGIGAAGYSIYRYFSRKVTPDRIERTSIFNSWTKTTPDIQKTALTGLTKSSTFGIAAFEGATATSLKSATHLTLFKNANTADETFDQKDGFYLAAKPLSQAINNALGLAETKSLEKQKQLRINCPECLERLFLKYKSRIRVDPKDHKKCFSEKNSKDLRDTESDKYEHVIAKEKHGFSKLNWPLEKIVKAIEFTVKNACKEGMLLSKIVQRIGRKLPENEFYLFVEGRINNNIFHLGSSWLRNNCKKRCGTCNRPIDWDNDLPPF
ncbi:hypothetical protein KAU11_05710 [Candidatus Babeliales bacterium]|nr:hypothetical protein [Candidatus Babeliales bacterium]